MAGNTSHWLPTSGWGIRLCLQDSLPRFKLRPFIILIHANHEIASTLQHRNHRQTDRCITRTSRPSSCSFLVSPCFLFPPSLEAPPVSSSPMTSSAEEAAVHYMVPTTNHSRLQKRPGWEV